MLPYLHIVTVLLTSFLDMFLLWHLGFLKILKTYFLHTDFMEW